MVCKMKCDCQLCYLWLLDNSRAIELLHSVAVSCVRAVGGCTIFKTFGPEINITEIDLGQAMKSICCRSQYVWVNRWALILSIVILYIIQHRLCTTEDYKTNNILKECH